jgi:hypothetical protein
MSGDIIDADVAWKGRGSPKRDDLCFNPFA